MRKKLVVLVFVTVFLGLAALLAGPALADNAQLVEISLGQAIELSEEGNISNAIITPADGTMVLIINAADAPISFADIKGNLVQASGGMRAVVTIGPHDLADLQEMGFVLPADFQIRTVQEEDSGTSFGNVLLFLLPLLLIVGLIFLLFRAGRGGSPNQAMNFGRSRARLMTPDMPGVSFTDVAGAEEAKEDLTEVVQFLRDKRRFQQMGATIPKGVLLTGPPGTGKTLLARAVAGEAGVPFFSISGSEFVEMFVGVGAARVRDLFEQAKKQTPCIIFIDEIDAVGRLRSGGMPGGHEEREQTLNQILTEMDGFDPNLGVIVLAATNRPDVLDPALLRPGRFDRRVNMDPPDTNGRKAILEIHARGKPLDENVDLDVLAKQTHGFTGADLRNLMNEAAILAVRRNKKSISMKELDESIDRVIAGPERKSIKVSWQDRETTAYHEAGHALVANMLPHADPVMKISIVARGTMGGYTRLLTEDRYFMTRSKLRDSLATLLAGHVSEEIVFAETSTGPHNDIKQATALARRMVTDFGMSSKLGLRTFGSEMGSPLESKDYSEFTAKLIDDEVATILDEARDLARKVLIENRGRLNHLAQKLVENDILEGEELETAFNEPLDEKRAARRPQQPGVPTGEAAPAAG